VDDLSHLLPDGADALVPTGQQSDGVAGNRAMTASGSEPAHPGFTRADDSPPEVEETDVGDGGRHLVRGER
jgi:hypothetical protein